MSATISVSGNTTHEIFMRFENAVTTDSNLSVCYSRFRHLRSLYKAPQAPQICRREAKWNFMKASTIAHVRVCLSSISQPANRFHWVLQGNNKDSQNLYANLLFLLMASLTKFTCFCERCFHFFQKGHLRADLFVTQDRLWKQKHTTDCKIKWWFLLFFSIPVGY